MVAIKRIAKGDVLKCSLITKRLGTNGGTERVCHGFASWLQNQGHQVTVFCSAIDDPIQGIEMIHLGFLGRGRIWKQLSMNRRIPKLPPMESGEIRLSFARGGSPKNYRAGGGCHQKWVAANGNSLADAIETRIDRQTCLHAQRIIVNSNMASRDISQSYGIPEQRIHLVRNGVDLNRFRPTNYSETQEQSLLFIGNSFNRKGLSCAIETLKLLPNAHLRVIGVDRNEKSYRQYARKIGVEKRVEFIGFVKNPESCFKASNVFVLPTTYDPAANSCLEAMACGLPVITTPSNGISEILPEPWMVQPPKADVFAEAIQRALQNPSIGNKCREIAELFSAESSFQSLFECLIPHK